MYYFVINSIFSLYQHPFSNLLDIIVKFKFFHPFILLKKIPFFLKLIMSNDGPLSSKQTEFNSLLDKTLQNKKIIDKYSINEEILNKEIESIYQHVFDEVIFGFAIQIHRSAKLGFLFFFYSNNDTKEQKNLANDIEEVATTTTTTTSSRNNLSKYECKCPNCNRTIAAIRFAPHLEKCMGLGRSSSRMASRRIASYNFDEYDQFFDEDLTQNSISSSSSSNLIDLDSTAATLKPPSSKRKRMQTSASMQNLSSSTHK
jgi:hypothetical protein